MGRRVALLATAAFLLLSGCASPASPVPASPLPDANAASFAWSGCHGGNFGLSGLVAAYPRSAPAAWGPPGTPLVGIRVVLLQCERVSWGPFERGPVSIAQEWRDDFTAPAACEGSGSDRRYVLESIWFSDPDLAAYAAARGLPAREARFEVANGTGSQTWTWGPPGEEPSMATFGAGPGANPLIGPFVRRLMWADGNGVGALDLRYTSMADGTDPPVAAGNLRPPTLYGRANAEPAFVSAEARAGLVHSLDATGDLHRYGDPQCEQPL